MQQWSLLSPEKSKLHIEKFGFSLSEYQLKEAGISYSLHAELQVTTEKPFPISNNIHLKKIYFHWLIENIPQQGYEELTEALVNILEYYTNMSSIKLLQEPQPNLLSAKLLPSVQSTTINL